MTDNIDTSTSIINILAVDDQPQNLLVLEKYLRESGISIITADSGNQALGLVLEHTFALILMDVQMPEMDGFETAELIRQNTDTSEVPIIFVTAINKEEQHIFRGYESGAVDYLFKPFDPIILKSKVDVFVRLHRQKIELENQNRILEERVASRTADLQTAMEKAEQANRAKSRFLSNMTHELMTPLHHIISYASFGLKGCTNETHPKLHSNFKRIVESSERLRTLAQNLLDLSLLQSGSMAFNKFKSDLENIINTLVVNLDAKAQEKSIRIIQKKAEFNTTVIGDSEKLSTLFTHVIVNAVQYSESGQPVEIAFKESVIELGESSTPAILVSITDQGVGIPKDELELIFDKFAESSSTKSNSGGTGLGLAICHEIAKAHSGRIWAENTDSGTVVKVLLPRNDAPFNSA